MMTYENGAEVFSVKNLIVMELDWVEQGISNTPNAIDTTRVEKPGI